VRGLCVVTCNMTAEIAMALKLQQRELQDTNASVYVLVCICSQINRTEIYFKIHKMPCSPLCILLIRQTLHHHIPGHSTEWVVWVEN